MVTIFGCHDNFCLLLKEEEGIATSRLFSESGLVGLLEQAAPLFREV